MATKKPEQWKPRTPRGRKLAALLKKGEYERGRDLTFEELEAEIRERRGGIPEAP